MGAILAPLDPLKRNGSEASFGDQADPNWRKKKRSERERYRKERKRPKDVKKRIKNKVEGNQASGRKKVLA